MLKKILILLLIISFCCPLSVSAKATENNELISDYYEYVNHDWIESINLDNTMVYIDSYSNINYDVYSNVYDFIYNPPIYLRNNTTWQKYVSFYDQLADTESRSNASMIYIKETLDKIDAVATSNDMLQIMYNTDLSLFNKIFDTNYKYSNSGDYYLLFYPSPLRDYYYYFTDNESLILASSYYKELRILGYSPFRSLQIIINALKANKIIIDFWQSNNSDIYLYDLNDFSDIDFPIQSIIDNLNYDTNYFYIYDGTLDFYDYIFDNSLIPYIRDFYMICTLDALDAFGNDKLENISYSTDMKLMGSPIFTDFSDINYSPLAALFEIDSGILSYFYSQHTISSSQQDEMNTLISNIQKTMNNIIQWQLRGNEIIANELVNKINSINIFYGNYSEYNPLTDFALQDCTAKSAVEFMKSNRNYEKRHLTSTKGVISNNINLFSKNAFYNPDTNSIIISNGIFYGWDSLDDIPYAELLGDIGEILAHELGHALDSSSIFLNSDGIDTNFITEDEWNSLCENYNSIIDFYAGFTTDHGHLIDSRSCLVETIADLLAIRCCLQLARASKHFDYDTFFKTYARGNACVMRPKTEFYYNLTDNHLPARLRTNLILGMFGEFYTTYKIDKSSLYYIPVNDRVFPL